jgi:hypothetical protein
MLVERQRPITRQRLVLPVSDIARNAHADWAVASKVDQIERGFDIDFSKVSLVQLGFCNRVIPDHPVSLVTQHGFDEADI